VNGGNTDEMARASRRREADAAIPVLGGGTLEAHHKNLSRELARNPNVLRE
jgi:hypothetical protein